jgi:spore coat polysaccharide biosynthesis protein SpsF
VIATTTNATDDPIVELAQREGIGWHRGSEYDVLGRFVGAAREHKADVVVRITADCPLIDPVITDRTIQELVDHHRECDYVSNTLPRTYPRGLDVEALFIDTLLRVDRLAHSAPAREHVTHFIRAERQDLFLCRSTTDSEDNSDLRWTVDTEIDLDLVRALYGALDLGANSLSYRDILAYARTRPDLVRLNADVQTWTPV